MSEFIKVMNKYKRMCDSYGRCTECPLNNLTAEHDITCSAFLKGYPEEAEKIIMSWEKPVDWSKVKVDTKIFVKDFENSCWYERHFAKFENGKVFSWKNGTTSFTAPDENHVTAWDFAKLAEEGEQNYE